MNFEESERYLLSLGNEVSAMKLGLDNIRKLLDALGDPQDNYLKVQVAGTNGKGSVCTFLNSICLTAGISTGMYTSPHLVSITERIRIDGADISESEFAEHATHVRETSEALIANGELESVPTFFEQVTAIALLAFAKAKVELAILETGLGGRLDATTAANAEIAAITRIDLDHQKYLGETIEEIAAEKAAVINPGSSVVFVRQDAVVNGIIRTRCRELGITPRSWLTDLEVVKHGSGLDEYLSATFTTARGSYENVQLRTMLGAHQVENASVAIGIVEALVDEGFIISPEHTVAGLQTARHPGRLERIGRYFLDGAHNVGGARALRAYLDDLSHRGITMIFGAMNDKSIGDIASILFPRANQLIITRPDNSRALAPSEVAQHVPELQKYWPRYLTNNVAEALEKAEEVAWDTDIIVVTGSLYLVGEVKDLLKSQI